MAGIDNEQLPAPNQPNIAFQEEKSLKDAPAESLSYWQKEKAVVKDRLRALYTKDGKKGLSSPKQGPSSPKQGPSSPK
jgi:hypothetical protein